MRSAPHTDAAFPQQDARPARGAGEVVGRALAVAGAGVLLALLVLPWRPATLCLLRGLTGIPCPFCGGTTAMVQLGRGDLSAALQASPLVVLGAPLWVVWPRLAPALRARLDATVLRRVSLAALGVALVASQAWQLQRYLG